MDPQQGRTGMYHNYPQIINCTIVENLGYGIKGGSPTVVNSILYFNHADANGKQIYSRSSAVTYSDVQGGWPGDGNLDVDPCFARSGSWGDPDGASGSAAIIISSPRRADGMRMLSNGWSMQLRAHASMPVIPRWVPVDETAAERRTHQPGRLRRHERSRHVAVDPAQDTGTIYVHLIVHPAHFQLP